MIQAYSLPPRSAFSRACAFLFLFCVHLTHFIYVKPLLKFTLESRLVGFYLPRNGS